MKKILLSLMLTAGCLTGFSQTIVPQEDTAIDQLSQVTVTFENDIDSYDIQYIEFQLGNTYLSGFNDNPGFSVSIEGPTATIVLDSPLSNLYSYPDYGYMNCYEGSFVVAGEPVEFQGFWEFNPSNAVVPEVTVTPSRGSNNLSLSEITLAWENCGVELNGNPEDLLDDLFFGLTGQTKKANVKSIEATGDAGNLGYSKIVITVQNSEDNDRPFTTPGTYQLSIETDICKINTADGSALWGNEDFTFYITNYEAYPATRQTLTEFNGVAILGTDIVVKDLSEIKLYNYYIDTAPKDSDEDDEEGVQQYLIGSATSSSPFEINGLEGQLIKFDYDNIYSGFYTVFIPAGSVTADGSNLGEGGDVFWYFTLEGVNPSMPEVYSIPGDKETVTSLSTVLVAIGEPQQTEQADVDFYGLPINSLDGTVAVTAELTTPEGTREISGEIIDVIGDDSLDIVPVIGSYIQFELPDNYTEAGTYTLSVSAGEFNIKYNNSNTILNDAFTLSFIIEDDTTVAVESIDVDENGLYRVYNLKGQSLLTTKDILNLNNLEKGIYIVNGKKVIVRK